MKQLDMKFNHEKITYGEIKSGIGEQWNADTEVYKWLCRSKECDKRIGDTIVRLGQPEKLFNHKIWWECNVPQTVAAAGTNSRGKEHTFVSTEDIIHSQTFPEDYRFTVGGGQSETSLQTVQYVCGMSVPPLMIKRVVDRLIEQGVFYEAD